ncbi:MAG: metal-dependent hydrolase [Microthrixaceae bacterium]
MSQSTAVATADRYQDPAEVPTSANRPIPTRRIDFGFGEVDLPRHFMGDDLVFSHFVAVLSCLFPEGEDFFVKSVRNYRDRIDDPELKAQVRGFIGQEAIHGREHRAFNEALRDVGYPVGFLDGRVRIGLRITSMTSFKSTQLAMTAALEHYTATFAEILLNSDTLQAGTDIDEIRNLFLWHALEENEHKSVAFDVFQSVCGKERVRINVMRATTVGFLASIALGMAVSLALDPASRDLPRLRRSLAAFRSNPLIGREMRTRIREYNRRGFHPEDRDTTELLETWRTKLFGPEGTLRDKLKSARAA